MILRVGLRSSCEYEWSNHVPGALSAGITSDEIASLASSTGSWSDAEAAALDLVDDLCADDRASENTWKALTLLRKNHRTFYMTGYFYINFTRLK
jgi:alkylhydroperoxidase family enzyme